jgi:two-component system cell cycle sensor histidine kinase/response regulator CckA
MSKRLRILHLEDDPDYSRLAQDLLQKENLNAEVKLVTNQADFEAALEKESFDVILADFLLPNYTGLRALVTAREKKPETPFLLVSGTIGEHAAIESLHAGATDYVLKQWPERLVPAVQRAVREAEERERRRKAETDLVRHEKYFRALTENALDVLTVVSVEGNFIYNSPSIKRVLGYEPAELEGQSAFAHVHPDDLPRALETFQRALANPDLLLMESVRFKRRDGSWVYIEVVGQNRSNDPDIAGVVLNTRDVTERKNAERLLRESEQEYRLLFHGNPNPMWVFDLDTLKILQVNEAAIQHYGYSREEFLSMSLADVRVVDDQSAPREKREHILKKEIQASRERKCVWQHRRKDSSLITVEAKWNPITFQGRFAALTLVNDITAQRRLEEQLRQSQKMEAIGQLAGGVAHDFNNILTVIHGHASLLVASANTTPSASKSAQEIMQAAGRAAGLTRQLLTFSRRQVLQAKRLDLNDVVANMTKMLGRLLGEDVALDVQYWPQPPFIEADSSMIEQVLLNLAVNARDAMPNGGQLDLRISVADVDSRFERSPEARCGRFVRLSMSDTGTGITSDNLRRIFEPFFTTKEVGKGTGLGLATVYGIVNQHKGWINVDSTVGKGTTFDVYLPIADGASEQDKKATTRVAVKGGSETILVVEDESSVRELVGSILRRHGYKVLEAESGAKALAVWANHKEEVDLLLTDLVMPDRMNGRELAERLRTERPRLKVIFTSGYTADVVGKEFQEGGLHYLQKPYHPQTLALAVRDCLDAKTTGSSMGG